MNKKTFLELLNTNLDHLQTPLDFILKIYSIIILLAYLLYYDFFVVHNQYSLILSPRIIGLIFAGFCIYGLMTEYEHNFLTDRLNKNEVFMYRLAMYSLFSLVFLTILSFPLWKKLFPELASVRYSLPDLLEKVFFGFIPLIILEKWISFLTQSSLTKTVYLFYLLTLVLCELLLWGNPTSTWRIFLTNFPVIMLLLVSLIDWFAKKPLGLPNTSERNYTPIQTKKF